MTPSQSSWDVLVIGGGPAGSTAASLLAKKGYEVLLVEKSDYPRFHIGESLLPGTWPIWFKLGVDEALQKSGQVVKLGTRFNLFDTKTYRFGLALDAQFFPNNRDHLSAFHVVRSEYDQLLLDNARRLGVEVLQPGVVQQVTFEGTRATGAVLKCADGEEYPVSARMLVDASGRESLIARKLDLRHPDPKLNKIAYFAHFKGCYREHPTDVPFWAFAFEGAWIWYITLKNDITSIGVVVDTDYAKTRAGRDLWEFFYEALGRAPALTDWIKNATAVSELHVISSLSYYSDRFVGDNWVLIGDAAMFVDPIFSSGVHLGMKGGDIASEVIDQAFKTGDFTVATLGEYKSQIRVPMRFIFPMIYRWYEMLRNPTLATTVFGSAARFTSIQRKVNGLLGGAYEQAGGNWMFSDASNPPGVVVTPG